MLIPHLARIVAGVLLVALLASGCAGVSTEKITPGNEDPAAASPGAAKDGTSSADSGSSSADGLAGGNGFSSEGTGDGSSSEPRSTLSDFPPGTGLGGGYAGGFRLPVEALPTVSEVAVRAVVTRIDPPVFNTVSGEWDPPVGASAEELHNLYGELTPYTPIHLEVLEVLGARPESTIAVPVGEQLTLTLLGGAKRLTLSEGEARAIGIKVTVDDGTGPRLPDGSRENEAFPTGPVSGTVSMAPAVLLFEGDVVIVFLSRATIELYPGRVPKDVVVSLHATGFGIFRQVSANPELFMPANTPNGEEISGQELTGCGSRAQCPVGSSTAVVVATGRYQLGQIFSSTSVSAAPSASTTSVVRCNPPPRR